MCLGIPGRLIRWIDRDPLFARAEVEFAGVSREVQMACAMEADVGAYLIVHAGIAICMIDETEAAKTLRDLALLVDSDGDGADVS